MLIKQYFKTIFHCNIHVTGFSISAEEGGSKTCLMKEEGSAQEQCLGKFKKKHQSNTDPDFSFPFLTQ